VGLLRLFIFWRLARLCVPLILSAILLLAVSSSLRSVDTDGGKRSTTGIVSKIEHQLRPLIQNAQHRLIGTARPARDR
jgi:hypothetical protein